MKKALCLVAAMLWMGAPSGVAGQPLERHGENLFRDANGDGVISRQEFADARDAAFARLDGERDGRLTGEERRLLDRIGLDGEARGAREIDRGRNDDMSREAFEIAANRAFERADRDHDGRITRREADADKSWQRR